MKDINKSKQLRVRQAHDQILARKRKSDQYNLIKWEVCRQIEDCRRHQEDIKKRSQKNCKLLVAMSILIKILKYCAKQFAAAFDRKANRIF